MFFRTFFRPNFRVGGLHMRHPFCVSQCRVSNRIATCPDEQTERSQSFFPIFFHPNFRVSFLHKLHPPLYLTKFRVSHSEFYKPRRANGALANFVSNIFRTNFRVGVLHKRHPICVSYNSHITLSTFGFYKPRRANGALANVLPDICPPKFQSGSPT